MASTDSRPVPKKNVAYRETFPIYAADGSFLSGAAGLDSEVSKDGGAFSDCTNEATEIGSTGFYTLDLTSTEMNADTVLVNVKTSTAGAQPPVVVLKPEEAGDIRVDVTQFGGTNGAFTSGRPEVDTTHWSGIAVGSALVRGNLIQITGSNVNAASAQLGVNVVNFGGAAGTFSSGRPEVNASHAAGTAWNSGAITSTTFASGAITNTAIATNAIGSDELASSARTAIASTVWSSDLNTSSSTGGSFGRFFGGVRSGFAQAGASGSITLDAGSSATTDYYANCLISIIDGTGVDQAPRTITAYNGTTKVATITPNWNTNPSTDSVFVVHRDIAASADSGVDDALAASLYLNKTTIATLASQTSFTLTAGSSDNSAYRGCLAMVIDASSSVQRAVGVVSAYTGSTKTVTLATDPAIFTMAVGDTVVLLPPYLAPTVFGRTLDVSTDGEAGLDWNNIGSKTTFNNLTNTVISSVGTATTVGTIGTGGITSASFAGSSITAAALAPDAGTEIGTAVWATTARVVTAATNITSTGAAVPITAGGLVSADMTAISTDTTAANNAESFFDGTGYAGTNNVIPTVTTVGTTTDLTNLPSIPNNWITAAGINADAFTAAKFASDVTTEFQAGLATSSALSTAQSGITAIKAVTDLLPDAGALTSIATASALATVDSNVDSILVDTDTTLPATLATIAGYIDTEIATLDSVVDAIKLTTDKLDDTLEDDGGTYRFTANALEEAPTGGTAPTAEEIADEVRIELATELARIDVATSTRMATFTYTTPPTAVAIRTEIDSNSTQLAAIVADTNELQTDWVNGGRLDLILDARASQTSVDDIPTVSEFNARTLVSADYVVVGDLAGLSTFDPSSDTVAHVTLVDTTTTNTDMRGTDNAALASVCTNTRLAELDAANLPADVAAVKSDTAAILLDTGTDGVVVNTFTTAGKAEIQAEATDALNAYDGPTKAELDTAELNIRGADNDTLETLSDQLDAIPMSNPSAGTIADAVWDEARTGHNTAGTFGETNTSLQARLPGSGTISTLTAAQVNTEADTALSDVGLTAIVTGRIDAAVSTRSSHSAADVWGVGSRTLTAFAFEVTVGGYASGQSPADLVDLSGLSTFDHTMDSVQLAATQLNYAPAKAGDAMALSDGAITDSKFTLPSVTGVPTGIVGMIHWVAARLGLARVTKDADEIKVMRADGTTVRSTNTYTSSGSDDDVGAAT